MKRESFLTKPEDAGIATIKMFDRWGQYIYGFVLRAVSAPALASDITIHTFLSYLRSGKDADNELHALLEIARRKTVTVLHAAASNRQAAAANFDFKSIQKQSSSEGKKLNEKLAKVQSSLEPKCKTILEMAYFNGLAQSEIETALNLPEGTTGTRLRRAVNDLRRIFSVN